MEPLRLSAVLPEEMESVSEQDPEELEQGLVSESASVKEQPLESEPGRAERAVEPVSEV